MPERRPNICCGCGSSGFSSRSRQSWNGFISPPQTWSVSNGGSAPTKPGFAVTEFSFLAALQHHRERNCGPGGAEAPTTPRSAALRPLNQPQEYSPAASHSSSLKKNCSENPRPARTVSGQSGKLSPLEADDSPTFISKALQQQKQPHGVFQEENL